MAVAEGQLSRQNPAYRPAGKSLGLASQIWSANKPALWLEGCHAAPGPHAGFDRGNDSLCNTGARDRLERSDAWIGRDPQDHWSIRGFAHIDAREAQIESLSSC